METKSRRHDKPEALQQCEMTFALLDSAAFVAKGKQLKIIKDLFRAWQASAPSKESWAQYVPSVLRISLRQADRLISAADAFNELRSHLKPGTDMPETAWIMSTLYRAARNEDMPAAWLKVLAAASERQGRVTARLVKEVLSSTAEHQAAPFTLFASSKSSAWYTPVAVLDKVVAVFGRSIGTDPASDEFGQSRVRADVWYGEASNGLEQDWVAPVFINTPSKDHRSSGSHSQHADWVQAALKRFDDGRCSGSKPRSVILPSPRAY
jgi:hypothetical protein